MLFFPSLCVRLFCYCLYLFCAHRRSLRGVKEAVQWVIRDWLEQNPTKSKCNVLDVGAGLGLLSVYAAQTSPKVSAASWYRVCG